MLTGLEILLARMKTNPEEFLKDNHVPYEGESFGGKWNDLISYAWRIATEEERQMMEDARREFYRDDFNERVMKRLAGEETPVVAEKDLGLRASNRKAAQQQMLQNSVLQGGHYDPNLHGYLTTTTGGAGGFQPAELKQEGAPIPISNGGTGFLGLRNLFWG